MGHRENPADPTYVYVAGRGHSGTTLLGFLLGNHPDICGVGELMYLPLQCFRDHKTRWEGLCGCGERPFNCEFWSPIIADIESEFGHNLKHRPFGWRISDAGIEEEYRSTAPIRSPYSWARHKVWRALRRMQYSRHQTSQRIGKFHVPQKLWIERRDYLARRISKQSCCSVIADISKDYLDMRDVYDYSSLQNKVIFITRDCRANIWSQVRMHCKRHGDASREHVERVIVRSSRDWVSVNRRILSALEGVRSKDWIHVRYEDICRNTVAEMDRVLQFAGLQNLDEVLDFNQPVEHTIAGNRVRFGGKMKAIREDLAWQDELRPGELRIIADICGTLAGQLGYSF
ncbi:MAG: sulfotransferase [Gammaproteobacteria bacterium]|nr:sulfotransferase [Gammaproteobacteria bacterium]MDH5260676.1 sulfotransferase [Gammaproteobacteria bacterium]